MIMETERLLIRPWREADKEPFYAINSDPDVIRFLLPVSRAQSDALVDGCIASHAQGKLAPMALEEKKNGALIGLCGVRDVSFDAPFTPAIEIAWRLASAYHGKGFAFEAASSIMTDAFNQHALSRIVAFTVPANRPSWRLMKRLGMRKTGTFRHPLLPADHPLSEHVLYEKP